MKGCADGRADGPKWKGKRKGVGTDKMEGYKKGCRVGLNGKGV